MHVTSLQSEVWDADGAVSAEASSENTPKMPQTPHLHISAPAFHTLLQA